MMNYYGYGPMMGYGGWGPLGFLWPLLWLVVILIVVGAIVRARHHGHRHWWHDHGNSALDILKERYAKGEIDKKEYEEKKKDLE
jgi:putative membrane protein